MLSVPVLDKRTGQVCEVAGCRTALFCAVLVRCDWSPFAAGILDGLEQRALGRSAPVAGVAGHYGGAEGGAAGCQGGCEVVVLDDATGLWS